MVQDKNRIVWFFGTLVASLAFALLCARRDFLGDPDTFWHIKTGGDTLADGGPLGLEVYSHSFKGRPYLEVEWLSQIPLYLAHHSFGWAGVTLLAAALTALTLTLFYVAMAEVLSPILAVAATIAAGLLTTITFHARPHLFALPLLVFWTWRLFRAARLQQAPSFWLLPLVALWANMHPSYMLAFVIAGFAFLDVAYETRLANRPMLARWVIFGLLCPVMAMINPFGFKPMLIALSVASDNNTLAQTQEWSALDIERFKPHMLAILAVFALFIAFRPKLRLMIAAFMFFMLYMFLSHIRFVFAFTMLAPIAVLPVLAGQSSVLSKVSWMEKLPDAIEAFVLKNYRLMMALPIVFMLGGVYLLSKRDIQPNPANAIEGAISFAKANGLKGNVLNHYDFGGALIFNGIPTFIDGRTDQLYIGKFWEDYREIRRPEGAKKLDEIIKQQNITWTLFPPDEIAVHFLGDKPEWREAYRDKYAVIHVRKD